ncbi:AMP-binding protein [Aeromicrobium sp. CF3.5]|uniref:AMP-binding protein n=1 Tax=Aeromicrobium sp. CF3.5 TaxID=3373078 RepID=UPI003EE592FC
MTDLAYTLKVFRQIGLIKPALPHRLIGAGIKLATWGPGFPSGVMACAARYPHQTAVIDDAGSLTWREMSQQINQLTDALKDRGVDAGDSVALLARNHRYIIMAMVAIMQRGARVLLLNTMASSSQLTELARRESASLVMLDEEFVPVAQDLPQDDLMLTWSDGDSSISSVAEAIVGRPTAHHPKPEKSGSVVIFTSGTTGLPKGARREEPQDLKPLVTYFGAIPYSGNSTVVLAAPLFHSWGLINFGFGLSTCPTYVLRRKFDPAQVLRDIQDQRAEVLVVVPLMMQRLVDVDPAVVERTDVSSLKITASSGSALAGDLANHFMNTFTDSVYNFYGATETGWVTIASPRDLREAPGTAGRTPHRTTVKILGTDGSELSQGETGVIHVGNDMPFGGYTDGNTKDFADGLMSTGDLGHFDADGRLFVSGRDDDMIISGGENVFPRELEDALIDHRSIADVVVVGIDDARWGQVLAAYVVTKPGQDLGEDEVVSYAKEHVARYAVPGRVKFIDELPRNPTGKVMKRELPDFD